MIWLVAAWLLAVVALVCSELPWEPAEPTWPQQCRPCIPVAQPMPPGDSRSHDGIRWPTLCIDDSGGVATHFFTIGDWGGWVGEEGPQTFDNTRYKRKFIAGVDNQAQHLVAESMRKVAKTSKPKFTINVGDNFYPGGIESNCGQKDLCSMVNTGQWQYLFEDMYDDPDLNRAPWHGVLGNHDFGGFQFNKGWDQQIAYTWHTDRWILPALYWERRMQYCDFAIDFFFIDTNTFDAYNPDTNQNHNICGRFRNANSNCSSVNGPSDPWQCLVWFRELWQKQTAWLEERLNASDAEWQVIVTHFPPQWGEAIWRRLTKTYGVDLIIVGHRHQQEVHYKDGVVDLGGTAWIVTGGGGGCTSESDPYIESDLMQQYGFVDVTVEKDLLTIDMWSWQGKSFSSTEVVPVPRGGAREEVCYLVNSSDLFPNSTETRNITMQDYKVKRLGLDMEHLTQVRCRNTFAKNSCQSIGCGTKGGGPCQCNKKCLKRGNCCNDFEAICLGQKSKKKKARILAGLPAQPVPRRLQNRTWAMSELAKTSPEASTPAATRRLSQCLADRRRHRGGRESVPEDDPWNGQAPGTEHPNRCSFIGCDAPFDPSRPCQCSTDCMQYKSCCSDFEARCSQSGKSRGGRGILASCAALGCGEDFVDDDPCQCMPSCKLQGNCCPDYDTECTIHFGNETVEKGTRDGGLNEEDLEIMSNAIHQGWEDYAGGVQYLDRESFAMQTDLASESCLGNCGGYSGLCSSFCGAGRACCRQGAINDSPECARAFHFLTDHYECVGLTPLPELPAMHDIVPTWAAHGLRANTINDSPWQMPTLQTWFWILVGGFCLFATGLVLLLLDTFAGKIARLGTPSARSWTSLFSRSDSSITAGASSGDEEAAGQLLPNAGRLDIDAAE